MKLKVKAGSEKLRQATVKLPGQLRVAAGKRRFNRGSAVKAGGGKASVKHSGRTLKLKAKSAAKSFSAKIAARGAEAGQGAARELEAEVQAQDPRRRRQDDQAHRPREVAAGGLSPSSTTATLCA